MFRIRPPNVVRSLCATAFRIIRVKYRASFSRPPEPYALGCFASNNLLLLRVRIMCVFMCEYSNRLGSSRMRSGCVVRAGSGRVYDVCPAAIITTVIAFGHATNCPGFRKRICGERCGFTSDGCLANIHFDTDDEYGQQTDSLVSVRGTA